uniref:Luciferase n=1 Tax=Timema shepardi TaxID=629360 RepID=A0A7R9ANE9_TIMSH|nr:unnamed protein product [Timema shepardi]
MDRILRGRPLDYESTLSVQSFMELKLSQYKDKVAQVDADSGAELTYCEVRERSTRLSQVLAARGVDVGDCVMVCSENCLHYCWVLMGILKARACCHLVNHHSSAREYYPEVHSRFNTTSALTNYATEAGDCFTVLSVCRLEGELEHALSISSPKLVLCSSDVAQKNTATLTGSDTVSEVLVWGEEVPLASKIFTSLEEVLASVDMADTVDTAKVNESTSENSGTETRTEVEKSDSSEHGSTARRLENFGWTEASHFKDHVAFILGSSGSTGLPKGVMLTHNNIVAALTRRTCLLGSAKLCFFSPQSGVPLDLSNLVEVGLNPIGNRNDVEAASNTVQPSTNIVKVAEDILGDAANTVVSAKHIHSENDSNSATNEWPLQNIELIHSLPQSQKAMKRVRAHQNHDFVAEEDVALGLMPFCHAYGLILMLMCLVQGARMVIMSKFSVDTFFDVIPKFKINVLHLVPSLLSLLCKEQRMVGIDLGSVCRVFTGAAPISPGIQTAVKKCLPEGTTFYHSYGLTETTFVMLSGECREDKPYSPGMLVSGMECKVVDPTTRDILGPNEKGELCFRGPLLMKGYMNNMMATQEALDEEGWLYSGDLGYYDTDGYFFIVDRLKELIKYQGYQVSPSELESILLTHPAVKDVAVVGIPEPVFGELPLAYIVKQPGVSVKEEEIHKFLNVEVSSYKRLRGGVKFVDFIPKTSTGKIQRKLLAQQTPPPKERTCDLV